MANLSSGNGDEPEFQIAPMIDVLLVLLVFFMSITTLQVSRVDSSVNLPVAPHATPPGGPRDESVINVRWDAGRKRAEFSFEDVVYAKPETLVPLLARRSALAARLLLPVAGIANTVLMARLLGPQAGLDYLLIPCAALGAVLFRATERKAMLAVVGLALAAWLLADGPPGVLFDAAGYAALRRMNAISAIALCGLIGWLTPRAAPLLPPRA